MSRSVLIVPLVTVVALAVWIPREVRPVADEPFLTSDRCLACHKGVSTSTGEDVSIGFDWRASMMANSGRDPYWQAAVRREVIDHPDAAGAIEDECSRCHMPMASELTRSAGGLGSVFANLPGGAADPAMAALAADGVSCVACHRIEPDGLGEEESFVGGFTVDLEVPAEGPPVYGPFVPDEGGAGIMHSATGFRPVEGTHVQSSELCASCHTLFTHAIRGDGGEGPEFPEQVPYLEWQASSYAATGQSCQSCHMPVVGEDVPVTGVLGRDRSDVSRHVFRGGNFFMQRMLDRYRGELGVLALPQELQLAAMRTEEHLRDATATVDVTDGAVEDDTLGFAVTVRNRAGHKFPTAYPSRRAWLHVRVADAQGRTVFESGAFRPDGSIEGNDNDADPTRYEPHYEQIVDRSQVQVYEAVMVDGSGDVTTGLLRAERWIKDNRLLPDGFDPSGAEQRIGVYGRAEEDDSFTPGGDRIRYRIDVPEGAGPFAVTAELWFQPIAYRWAHNLGEYDAFETNRFVRYYESMASGSALVIASAGQTIR